MSAFMSYDDGTEAVILSDGAAYRPDGTIVSIGSKVTVGQMAPIAITTRGNHVIGKKHQKRICEAADKIGVDAALNAFSEIFPQLASKPEYRGMDFVHYHIVAWSESRGLIRLSGHNLPHAFADGEEPGALREVTGPYVAGNACTAAEYGLAPREAGEGMTEYLYRVGADIMEAWRRKPATLLPGEESDGPQYLVGGQVDFTLVTMFGATTVTLRTWPEDMVGQKINPHAVALPEPVAA